MDVSVHVSKKIIPTKVMVKIAYPQNLNPSKSTLYIAGKFGRELNLVVWWSTIACNHQLKSANISYSCYYMHVVIPYRTTKFKSANIFFFCDGDLGPNHQI